MRRLFFFTLFLFGVLLSACSIRQKGESPSLEEMAGGMIMVGFQGTSAPPSVLEAVAAGRIGGVILFDKGKKAGESYNIESPAQLKALTSSLQNASPRTLLIAVDQEGGDMPEIGRLRRVRPSAHDCDCGEQIIHAARHVPYPVTAHRDAQPVNAPEIRFEFRDLCTHQPHGKGLEQGRNFRHDMRPGIPRDIHPLISLLALRKKQNRFDSAVFTVPDHRSGGDADLKKIIVPDRADAVQKNCKNRFSGAVSAGDPLTIRQGMPVRFKSQLLYLQCADQFRSLRHFGGAVVD